jgi:hypothetical protein
VDIDFKVAEIQTAIFDMQAEVHDMKSQVDEIHAAVISSSNPPLSCFFIQIPEHSFQIFPPCKQVKV